MDDVKDAPFLKLKLGTGDPLYDLEIVRTARASYTGPLCVDANSAWSIPEAVKIIPDLSAFELVFIEQPIKAGEHDDWHLLIRLLPRDHAPLIADESIHSVDDVLALAGAVAGINVKIAKCGRNAQNTENHCRRPGTRNDGSARLYD